MSGTGPFFGALNPEPTNRLPQNGLTHAFVVQFANPDDRNYYVETDPAHRAFRKTIEPLVEKVTVLDFTHGTFD